MTARDWLRLVGLSLLWGGSFFFVELAIPSFTPFSLVFVRVAVAALLMGVVLRRRALWKILCERWRAYAVVAFFGSALPFVCFAWGQRYIDSGLAGVLNALTPMCVFVFAVFLGRERFSLSRGGGILLGVAGVVLLLKPDASAAEWGGVVAGLVAAVSYAVAATLAWARVRAYPPAENVFGQLCFAALFVLPPALLERPWEADFMLTPVLAILSLSVFSTFAAYLLYYRMLADSGAVNTTLFVLLLPVIATALGVLLLGEQIGTEFYIGGGMILTGLALTDSGLRRVFARLFGYKGG